MQRKHESIQIQMNVEAFKSDYIRNLNCFTKEQLLEEWEWLLSNCDNSLFSLTETKETLYLVNLLLPQVKNRVTKECLKTAKIFLVSEILRIESNLYSDK